jgi:hypothetical protein
MLLQCVDAGGGGAVALAPCSTVALLATALALTQLSCPGTSPKLAWWHTQPRSLQSTPHTILKKSAHSYLLYLLTSYVLAERVEYTKDTFASASLEFCTLGGSYFRYSLFPGVMLASLMHIPESLFQTCNSFY